MELFNKLFVRYLFGENDPDERREAEKHIETDESLANKVSKFRQLLSMKSKKLQITDVDIKWEHLRQNIENIEQEMTAQTRPTRIPDFPHRRHRASRSQLILRYAAVIIITVCLGFVLNYHSYKLPWTQTEVEYKVVKVGNQERFTVSLSDGSTITLDAGSELKYPTEFRANRDVYLTGEAYFDIAHADGKPFQVHAGNSLIRVLGTRFNVRNWDYKYKVIVTVNEGTVLLQSEDKSIHEKVVLKKNQQSVMGQDGRPSEPIMVDPSQYTGWMNNEIHFENATVREVLAQLEQWYNFTFELSDTSILDQLLTVHIQRTTVNDVFQLISIVTETDVIRDGKRIKFIKK